jgi:hypothetical protein
LIGSCCGINIDVILITVTIWAKSNDKRTVVISLEAVASKMCKGGDTEDTTMQSIWHERICASAVGARCGISKVITVEQRNQDIWKFIGGLSYFLVNCPLEISSHEKASTLSLEV